MEVNSEITDEEYDEMTEQIKQILLYQPPWVINGEKGFIRFQPRDCADVHIFQKICDDDGLLDYVFVFEGYYILEEELPEKMTPEKQDTWEIGGYRISREIGVEGMIPGEYDEIKKQIWEILKDQPPKV